MNPVKRLISWLQGASRDPEAVAGAQRLREDRNTIRISQNTPGSQFGVPTNLPPTPDMLDPGSEDSRNYR
jgi:hypothetical protein